MLDDVIADIRRHLRRITREEMIAAPMRLWKQIVTEDALGGGDGPARGDLAYPRPGTYANCAKGSKIDYILP